MTQMDSETIPGSTLSSSTSSSLSSASSSSQSSMLNNSSSSNNSNQQQLSSYIQQYNWYYDKSEMKRTPSIMDGITYEKERMYRNEGARFILNAGLQMKLRYDTLATGVVYFHRFYMRHSFKVFPRYVTAACCLFLAGKAEETPKKCKDIIKIARALLDENQFSTFSDDPKEEVLTLERIVLQTIRFDLQVEHPYKYLVTYAKCFKGNKEKIQAMLQMAWTFTNDSLCTTICLQWEPEIVAIAMIFLASKIRYEITDWEGRLPHQKHWWDIYVEDLSVELLEDICHQVLDLYSNSNEEQNRSPPPTPSSSQSVISKQQSLSSSPSTPIKIHPQQQLTLPPNVPQPTSAAAAATSIAPIGQYHPIVNATTVPAAAAVAIPPPPPPTLAVQQPNATTIPAVPNLTQWDPAMASFYNYPLAGIAAGKTHVMHPATVHMVPPPPPPPMHGIPTMGLAIAPQPPPPPIPPSYTAVNQHQPT